MPLSWKIRLEIRADVLGKINQEADPSLERK